MPDIWYDVDTALAEVPVNVLPLLDDGDFKSIEAGVAYDAGGLALYWHFVTTGGAYSVTAVTPTTGGAYDWTDQGDAGIYTIEIPASGGASINNDTEGFGWFTGVATGVLPWRGPTIGFRAAGLNNALIDSAYSATRGLAGSALPDAAADAAGGLPISDAGGLDLDTILGRITGNVATAAKLLSYFQSALRKDVTVDADIGGNYDDATDSQEAIRDHIGDGANLTEAGGTGDQLTALATASALTTLSGIFTGITSLAQWLGLIAGKQTGNSTARTELRATGAGSGTYDETTDSQEAIRDKAADLETDTQDLQTQIGTAGAGLTDLGGMSTGMKGEVQQEATDALNAYDPPTNTELSTAQTAIIDGVLDGVRISKNTQLANFMFKMVDATDHVTAETGVTVTATRSIDGGSFASCANSAAEVANGWYRITLADSDLNGDVIVLRFTGSGCDATEFTIITQPKD